MKNSRKIMAGLLGTVLVLGGPALAAASGNITLNATVQGILAITVTPTSAVSGLDLATQVSQLKIATVNAASNKHTGDPGRRAPLRYRE
ncbi:MAG: hypothetical protein FJX65_11300 [Alphaproteobacteria bacterium]|nr:hypothetical protein [Alphaproteobacteria bacterium]